MSSYTDVKNLIISNIKANGQREITGPILQDVLLNMLENSSEADAANKEYVDNKIADIPVEKGSGYQSMVQKVEGNTAEGQYSSAFGLETSASGNSANAEGWQTKSNGVASHAEGVQTEANGNASHAEGQKTITLNKAEHTEGTWNLSIKDKTIHTVGIGSNYNDRKNAHEIHLDGKHYVYGIGGYDGTNSQTEGIKTVQEVAEEVVNAVQIKYTDLKSLRDAGKLVPGQQYRITDYTCTTTQANTKSAGHQFDIIVTADDESTLNEEARAALHSGDEYFSGCSLNAWKIWYCLDNDTTRFAWADATNGKGVIYRMIDEWNNDAPYDFKNIQFYRKWDSGKSLWSTISSDNTGVPCYTFSSKGSSSTTSFTDYSLASSNSIYSNVIKKYVSSRKQTLNNICFFGNYCYSNTFGNKCYSNTFGNYCYYNTFGNNCQNNTFGNYCNSNTFGDYCYSNTFGNDCQNNTFGNNCYNNTFGNNYFSNILGNNFQNNTFGNYCSSNTFGNYCYNNTFGNNCYRNTFGNNFQNNTFGNDCNSNTFGNSCQKNTFGNNCSNNTFGNYCRYIKFASDSSSAATKYNYYQNNYFGDGCQYIVFTGAETASNSQQVQNYNFAQGLQGTSSAYLTIDGVRNRAYETYISRDTDGTIKESVIAEFENRLGNCVDLTSEQNITATKTFSAGISLNNTIIRKVKTPTANDDAANKQYVDNKIADIPVEKGSGNNSIIQKGSLNTASSAYSSAFGYNTTASMAYAHAEGYETTASGTHSHVEGYKSTASGQTSHAEGTETKATNDSAHAEGYKTTAARYQSHAEGNQTYAAGVCSHAEGFKTKTTNKGEHAEGLSNISIQGKTVHTVGIGSAEDNVEDRKNAEEIHVNGDKYVFGIGGYDGTNSQTEGIKTVQEVAEEVVNAVQITYADLKSLRDAGKLVPGQQYRITDYECTTMQDGTRSAGHVFDIIVTADDESTLNEVARAALHTGDEYFSGCNLSAWKIWYCLDNDANRFAWAMMKGKYIGVTVDRVAMHGRYAETKVINDITYSLWLTPEPYMYIGTKTLEVGEYCDLIYVENGNFVVGVENFSRINDIKDVEDGKGVIYRMIDEFDNDCPYDFKNIQFYRQWDENKQLWSTISYGTAGVPCYTFSSESDSSATEFTDMSLILGSQVYYNIIKALPGNQMLNNNCFFGDGCNCNNFGNKCSNNTFGNNFHDNTFGNNCSDNTFRNDCYRNTLGNSCYSNTFGDYCCNNAFGDGCYDNTLGNDFRNNTFGNDCYNNAFGNSFQNNTLGNYCYNNTFGNSCYSNTFGDYCYSNTLGNYCYDNTFGNNFRNNTFGSNCYNNAFGNSFQNNTLGNYCHDNTFGNGCYRNTLGDYCYSNTFGNYCSDNTFGNSCISDTFGDYCSGNTFGNYCYDNTFGNNCNSIKFASDSSASTKYNYYQFNHFGDGCQYIVFKGTETASDTQQVQNYNFSQGLQGTSSAYLTIDGVRNRAYETYISRDTDGMIKESVIAEKLDKVIEISYNDLVTLRGSSKLVPGQQYRITDYTCTTTQANTKSAGHQFDIIVTADDESTLNEEARAALHTGDEYFSGCTLSAWKLWYCLDNDTTRFAWADSTNGKGVIYRMIDEWSNDVPYDFKNIQFARDWSVVAPDSGLAGTIYCYTFSIFLEGFSENATASDESVKAKECIESDEGGLFGNNVIRTYQNLGVCFLNGIVFVTDWTSFSVNHYSNTFGNNCSSNTLGNECYSNTFGNDCYSNTFGNECYSNTFGNYCYLNTFGNEYYSNTFGNNCNSNTFGNNCSSNTFGNYCSSNTFGNNCSRNTFGNRCNNNTFGNNCYNNTFGNEFQVNTFGNEFQANTFRNNCNNNTFGNGFQTNTFGNNCYNNTFGNNCSSNTFGNRCIYIKFASDSSASTKYNYYQNNYFGDGCGCIVFTGAETASNSQQVQNYNFAQGLRGTSNAYISIDGKRNRAYETKVAKNSNGEIKTYCEADLIL